MNRMHQQELDKKSIDAAQTVSRLQKERAAQVSRLKSSIREKDDMIEGLEDLATGVAAEYSDLDRSARSRNRQLEETAAQRLNTLKQTKQRESYLRESLDMNADELAMAHAEIAQLKEQVAVLQQEVINAREEIKVCSLMIMIYFCTSSTNSLCISSYKGIDTAHHRKERQSEEMGRNNYAVSS